MSQANQAALTITLEATARIYAANLAKGRVGVSPEPVDYHYRFAEAVVLKNAYALEHLANGLNETGKKVFSKVTGIALPRTQKGTWSALMMWAGINPLQDAVNRTAGQAEREKRFLKERDVLVSDSSYQELDDKIKEGFREIKSIAGNRMLTNGTMGINLSKRGSAMHHLVGYINARINYENALDALESGNAQEQELSKAA
ncbi:MAG: hypothetical protein ACTS9Y_00550 [Methylophilus sp.]|uniref:hypothetical protein n=1 Tax=Methylophilus sp. TaxID=29541 RepID=UPI003F9ECE20